MSKKKKDSPTPPGIRIGESMIYFNATLSKEIAKWYDSDDPIFFDLQVCENSNLVSFTFGSECPRSLHKHTNSLAHFYRDSKLKDTRMKPFAKMLQSMPKVFYHVIYMDKNHIVGKYLDKEAI